jgi:hypothetical protein
MTGFLMAGFLRFERPGRLVRWAGMPLPLSPRYSPKSNCNASAPYFEDMLQGCRFKYNAWFAFLGLLDLTRVVATKAKRRIFARGDEIALTCDGPAATIG